MDTCWAILLKKTGQIDLIWPDLRHFSGLKSIPSRLKHLECMCTLKLLPYGMSTPNECFTGQRCQISGQNDLIWPKSAFLQPLFSIRMHVALINYWWCFLENCLPYACIYTPKMLLAPLAKDLAKFSFANVSANFCC